MALRTRKKKDHEQPSSSSLTTFTNLMILLLAFFIVLVNMSETDQQKKRVALNSLFGSFGFHPGGQSPIGKESGMDMTMPDSPLNKLSVDLEQLQNIAAANGLDSESEIVRESERIVIVLGSKVLFEWGQRKLSENSKKYLMEVSEVLKEGPGLIELRGYADRKEILLDPDPARSALVLSAKRVMAVLQYMVKTGNIPAERIVAHGLGTSSARRAFSLVKREWQGGVEIIVNYRQKVPYRLRINRKRDHILDFKGFLFKVNESQ